MVLDLDPQDIGFDAVIETALETRRLLDEIGAASYCKTSGEVNRRLAPEKFTLRTISRRLSRVGDLWKGVLAADSTWKPACRN